MASRGHVPELRGAGQAGLFGLRAIGRPSGLAFPGHRWEYRRRGARLDTGFLHKHECPRVLRDRGHLNFKLEWTLRGEPTSLAQASFDFCVTPGELGFLATQMVHEAIPGNE